MAHVEDTPPNLAILDKLNDELTDDLVKRLVAYCDMRAKRRPWYGLLLAEASMAEGHKPVDIVQTAITKTLDATIKGPGKHRRVWDGRRDLYDHLTSAIDSELSNLGNGWVNARFRRATQMPGVSEEGHSENFFDGVADSTAETPEEIALADEVEAQADSFVCGAIEILGEDDFLISVVQEILDGARKPAEIAKALGVRVEEIYKARKRLRNRLDDYRTAFAEQKEARHG